MLLVNKKIRSVFSLKKGFSTKFVNQMIFLNYPMSFLLTQVDDDIQEFDYSGNKIPDFFAQGNLIIIVCFIILLIRPQMPTIDEIKV